MIGQSSLVNIYVITCKMVEEFFIIHFKLIYNNDKPITNLLGRIQWFS